MRDMYSLFNVLCWLWNIYEAAELELISICSNPKMCIFNLKIKAHTG